MRRFLFQSYKSNPILFYTILTILILIVTAIILFFMGRIPICSCGYIKLWEGQVNSSGNSQHLSDWYTFSHLIHGFIFFGILSRFKNRLTLGKRFLIALCIEALWEILENTPMVINHYRSTTISLYYTGDSIINSLSDITAMITGFFLTYCFNWKIILFTAILFELTTGLLIRDNLTLNIIMLIHPVEWIKQWQMGG